MNRIEKSDFEKTNKSVSLKKIGMKNDLTINIDESPKSRTHKKVYR